jgi:hypothetical protein
MCQTISANQRRALRIAQAAAKDLQLIEQASWEETDKKAQARAARIQEREERADAKLQNKTERKVMEDRETEEVIRLSESKSPKKVTQAEVSRRQALACMSGMRPKNLKAPAVSHSRRNSNMCGDFIEASGLDDILMAFEAANQL